MKLISRNNSQVIQKFGKLHSVHGEIIKINSHAFLAKISSKQSIYLLTKENAEALI